MFGACAGDRLLMLCRVARDRMKLYISAGDAHSEVYPPTGALTAK